MAPAFFMLSVKVSHGSSRRSASLASMGFSLRPGMIHRSVGFGGEGVGGSEGVRGFCHGLSSVVRIIEWLTDML